MSHFLIHRRISPLVFTLAAIGFTQHAFAQGKQVNARSLGNVAANWGADTSGGAPVSINHSAGFGPETLTQSGRQIDGISVKAKANLPGGFTASPTTNNGSMGSYTHVGGSAITSLTPANNSRPNPWATTFVSQFETYRISGPAGGTSLVDMRITLDGELSRLGTNAGDLARVDFFGEYYLPHNFTSGDLFGFTQTLSTDATGASSLNPSTTVPTSAFSLSDWSNSFVADPGNSIGDALVTQAIYDETQLGVFAVPNNTDFAIISYLRTEAMSVGGTGNSSLADFYNTATIGVGTTTPGSTISRVSAVPEPTSCAALAVAGITGGIMRRRRRRRLKTGK